MNPQEIHQKVTDSADRFGADNPQQFKLLVSQLSKCSHENVFLGLITVFTSDQPQGNPFQRQELAGRLLAEIKPHFVFDLESTIRSTLPNYNRSIEQLPKYFSEVHGLSNVLSCFSKIESEGLADQPLTCLQTMRWWLTGSGKQ